MTPAEFPGLWHDGMNITRMGVVTTIHLCDLGIEGACPAGSVNAGLTTVALDGLRSLAATWLLLRCAARARAADAARLHAALQARWSR